MGNTYSYTHSACVSQILWNISPLSHQHPGPCEVDLLLLTDVGADPGEGLKLAVVVSLVRHFTNTSGDVSVRPERCHKVVVEACSWKEVWRVGRKGSTKGHEPICGNLHIKVISLTLYNALIDIHREWFGCCFQREIAEES